MESKDWVAARISALISVVEYQDGASSHWRYYPLSSEILKYKLILFRSDHFSLKMEKQNRYWCVLNIGTLWETLEMRWK